MCFVCLNGMFLQKPKVPVKHSLETTSNSHLIPGSRRLKGEDLQRLDELLPSLETKESGGKWTVGPKNWFGSLEHRPCNNGNM